MINLVQYDNVEQCKNVCVKRRVNIFTNKDLSIMKCCSGNKDPHGLISTQFEKYSNIASELNSRNYCIWIPLCLWCLCTWVSLYDKPYLTIAMTRSHRWNWRWVWVDHNITHLNTTWTMKPIMWGYKSADIAPSTSALPAVLMCPSEDTNLSMCRSVTIHRLAPSDEIFIDPVVGYELLVFRVTYQSR